MKTDLTGTRRKYDTSLFEKKSLSNGVTVWIQHSPILLNDEGVISVVLANVGGTQDPLTCPGVAHFFEHIPFRGTERMPDPFSLEIPVETGGGSIGATTSKYWTNYRCTLPGNQLTLAVNTAFELAFKAIIREDDVRHERGVIGTEFRRFYANGSRLAYWHMRNSFFGKNPHSASVIGDLDSINSMERGHLIDFRNRFYHPGNTHIICGGSFSEKPELLALLEETFGSLPAGTEPCAKAVPPPQIKTDEVELVGREYQRDRLVMMWPIERAKHETHKSLQLIDDTLARSVTSPLLKVLRLQHGLVYESGLLSYEVHPGFGVFTANIPILAEHFNLAQSTLRRCLEDMTEADAARELRYRQQLRSTSFSDPVDVCIDTRTEIVNFGEPRSFDQEATDIDSIDYAEVHNWRNHLLQTKPLIARIHGT